MRGLIIALAPLGPQPSLFVHGDILLRACWRKVVTFALLASNPVGGRATPLRTSGSERAMIVDSAKER
jgi:hypothetical protein